MARFPAARTVPLMFRTIVIGYDTPERTAESSTLAEALRDPDDGTVLLASAVSSRPLAVGGFTLAEDLGVICETTEALLAEARDALSGPDRVHTRAIPADSPARMLSELAEAEHADLVIVGASRRRELGRPLPGTTAEQVLRDAPCPVAVVPPRYTGGDIRRIGVAYDGSPEADVALSAAESLARDLNAALTVYCLAESASLAAGAGSGALAGRRRAPAPDAVRCGRHGDAEVPARDADPPRSARGGDRGQGVRRPRSSLRPPRALGQQRLRRTRACSGLSGRRQLISTPIKPADRERDRRGGEPDRELAAPRADDAAVREQRDRGAEHEQPARARGDARHGRRGAREEREGEDRDRRAEREGHEATPPPPRRPSRRALPGRCRAPRGPSRRARCPRRP